MPDNETTSPDEYGEVLDVRQVFFQAVRKKIKKVAFWTLLLSVWTLICVVFILPMMASSDFGFYHTILRWILFGVWFAIIYSKVREAFWKEVAKKYGWEYAYGKDISDEKALLFEMGDSREAGNGIIGSYDNQPFHIFEYEYTVGSGKHKTTYSFTVFEVKFTGTFPHLYLNYKSDWYSNTPSIFSSLAKISLTSEFEDKFKLYSPKEYEIETLEIFTPEILALLLDSGWNHDMEFVDGELIIYQRAKFNSFTELDMELNKIKKLVDILSPLLNRLKLAKVGNISPELEN